MFNVRTLDYKLQAHDTLLKMNPEEFSIYETPFTDETKKLRLNSLLASMLCLFIGVSKTLPSEPSLFGISFTSSQQQTVGWFIFFVSLYLFVHFLSAAAVEIAKWINPFLKAIVGNNELIKHPAFDKSDLVDWERFLDNEQDKNTIAKKIFAAAVRSVQGRLRPLYMFIYPKLFVEIFIPIALGLAGLTMMAKLIKLSCGGPA